MDTTGELAPNNANRAKLFTKMARVMGKMTRLAKSGYNKAQNYAFATESDVVDMVREAMAEENLAFIPIMTAAEDKPRGEKMIHWKAHFLFTFADGDTGETYSCPWIAEAMEYGDKGINKVATAAVKYFLLKTFLISTGDKDDDSDNHAPDLRKTTKSQASSGGTSRPTPPRPTTTGLPIPPDPETSANGNGHDAPAAIVWPSAEALTIVLHRLQGDTGVIDMSNHEFARLCGIDNVDDLDAWKSFESGKAAYAAAMKQFEAEQKPANAKVWTYNRDMLINHMDVILCYPQKNHRERTVDLLRGSGIFNDVPTLDEAAKRVRSYYEFRTEGMESAAAITRIKEFAEAF